MQQLKAKLPAVLKDFEKTQEWADIGNWLIRLYGLLKDYPTPFIPNIEMLGKRLAQCLYPTLPFGVHSSTLRVYDIVFHNIYGLAKSEG